MKYTSWAMKNRTNYSVDYYYLGENIWQNAEKGDLVHVPSIYCYDTWARELFNQVAITMSLV